MLVFLLIILLYISRSELFKVVPEKKNSSFFFYEYKIPKAHKSECLASGGFQNQVHCRALSPFPFLHPHIQRKK